MTTAALPRWDLSPAFPGPDSPELVAAFAELREHIAALQRLLVGVSESDMGSLSVDTLIDASNRLHGLYQEIGNYLYAWTTADTNDEPGKMRLSELQELASDISILEVRTSAWIGQQDVDALIASSPTAEEHAHFLRTERINAEHLMSLPEEELAAKLRSGAGMAWERLRDDVETRLSAPIEVDGETRERPISEISNLSNHPSRDVRRTAYEAELTLWESAAVPIAASMNGIKNEALILAERRGWGDPLDVSLHLNAIDQQVLDAIVAASEEIYGELREHMRLKARLLGLEKLAWYDIFAPLGDTARTYSWDETRELICDALGHFSPRLTAMLDRTFAEAWVDVGPRSGKVGGAYCTGFFPHGSRILMNFDGTLDSLSTLAHELGHAYHNECLNDRTPLQRFLPMTLAETASMMLQHLLEDTLLERSAPEERLTILNARLNDAVAIVLDLRARFEIEKRVISGRRERSLTVDELNALTRESQAFAYGDGLDHDHLQPFGWASKPHYYIVDFAFYNYPYQFGMLFGLGLYRKRNEPGFVEEYESLLSRTGMAPAVELAQGAGIDLRDVAFWRSSLDVIREDIRAFKEIAGVEATA